MAEKNVQRLPAEELYQRELEAPLLPLSGRQSPPAGGCPPGPY